MLPKKKKNATKPKKRKCLILLCGSALQSICWLHQALNCKLDFTGQRGEEQPKQTKVASFATYLASGKALRYEGTQPGTDAAQSPGN